jgi:hypothetical protein
MQTALFKALAAPSSIGTEHEYSINDKEQRALTVSDGIIERIAGRLDHEVAFGGILVSKELQKHAIELIPQRPGSLSYLENNLYQGLCQLLSGHQ